MEQGFDVRICSLHDDTHRFQVHLPGEAGLSICADKELGSNAMSLAQLVMILDVSPVGVLVDRGDGATYAKL